MSLGLPTHMHQTIAASYALFVLVLQAVNVLKGSRQLDLIIRKAAGLDLFPGESSGYNSSASSVNGDQSPNWGDTKRLSIVKEESIELEDRYRMS